MRIGAFAHRVRSYTRPVAPMFEFYPQIKAVHIACVILSGLLFALRGTLVQAGRGTVAHWAPLRYLSYSVDTVLLTAALMLMTIIHQIPGADAWLTAKVLLVAAYIVLGYYALRAATPRGRWASLVGAVLTFGFIYSVARAHHPLGFLA